MQAGVDVWSPMPESVHIFEMSPEPFRAVTLGLKQAVVLPLSLGVLVGDQVVLREWQGYAQVCTGVWLCRRVTHEDRGGELGDEGLSRTGIREGFAVYSLNDASENESARAYLADRLQRARREGLSQDQFWRSEMERERARRELLRGL